MNTLLVFKILHSLLFFLGGSFLPQWVVFESLESKTQKGEVVFNQISLEKNLSKDVWKMKQSHHGLESSQWDEVKIVVHKETTPYAVSFHQLKNGKEVEFKTSCFRCHPGGPRLIRPNFNSAKKPLSLGEKLQLASWNSLIKSYGETKLKMNNALVRKIPLVGNKEGAKKIIELKSCSSCHGEGKVRATLTYANAQTIKFLMKEGAMPPWPHKISKDDKRKLKKIIYGI